jgi:sec-independent protein translocase protein TatC
MADAQDALTYEDYKPYIKEARVGFWTIIILFAIGAVIGMAYYKQILGTLMGFFKFNSVNLVLTSPYQFIELSINSGFFVGVLLATPALIYHLLQFIKPALKPKEFKLLIRMLPISIILFIIGFIFGVWVLQFVVDLFSQTSTSLNIGNIWDLSGFLAQVVIMGMSMAFVFQMPIVMTSLIKLNVLTNDKIKQQRRVIYAVIVIFAALMPPTDLISMLILSLVPLFLFESTLLLNYNS